MLRRAVGARGRSVADRVITQSLELATEGLASVTFLGGEPTLAWPIIERLMDGYEAASEVSGARAPRYVMKTFTTNSGRIGALPEATARQSRH